MELARLSKCLGLPIGPIHVVADSMLGWLTRWLRMLGVHVEYSPEASDEELIGTDGLLVTRDKQLYRARRGLSLLLVTDDHMHWLSVTSMVLGTELRLRAEDSLCPICGSRLRRIGAGEAEGRVPPSVLLGTKALWECLGCGNVYWVGSHHPRINATLRRAAEVRASLSTRCISNELIILLK